MPGPTIKKLRHHQLLAAEAASLLKKHAGSGSNDLHCTEALQAIGRTSNVQILRAVKIINLLLHNESPCQRVESLIDQLQKIAFSDAAKPMQTGQPNVPAPAPKATRVVRAAEFSNQPCLETESEVDAYLTRLKSELLAVVRAGQKARIQ